MRNVKVMNIPVGVLAAFILALGYAIWGLEAAMASSQVASKPACSVVEVSSPDHLAPAPINS